jgi:AbrB family looped-hinge helix DNA binding protein
MAVSTISTKGQITLPVRMRRELGLEPKARVSVAMEDGAIVIRPVPDIFALAGFAGKAGTREEERRAMEKAAADHVMGNSD